MTTTLLTLALAVLAADPSPASSEKPKPKHSPYAPSLPYLTREEENRLDGVVDRFMLYDIGTLQGAEGKQAFRDFVALKAEAIPALVRGLNRAAMIEHSCPVVVIAEKLQRLVLASDDRELLEFVQDNIGSGVGATRHAGVLQELRFKVMLRKNYVARKATAPPAGRAPARMSNAELADAASTERGPRLQAILIELQKRKGPEVIGGLANAARSYDPSTRQMGRTLLDRHLAGQKPEVVKDRLHAEQAEVRKSALRVVVSKMPQLVEELVGLLGDEDNEVRLAARMALVHFSGGQDFGPLPPGTTEQIQQAQANWRAYLGQRTGR